jgi:integral membrane protein
MIPDAQAAAAAEERTQLRRLRRMAAVEGATLLLLLLVAVPAKHLFGYPDATRLVGPVHGVTFVAYAWTLLATVSGGGWRRGEIARLVLAALVPFGALANRGLLRSKEMALDEAPSAKGLVQDGL